MEAALTPTTGMTASLLDIDGNEVTYAGYARVSLARDTNQWAVAHGLLSTVRPICFPACIGGSAILSKVQLILDGSVLLEAELKQHLHISAGITPIIELKKVSISIE
jgi:hypothetical protein